MNYILEVRKFDETDANRECPTVCEDDEFRMRLNALIEDIESISNVSSVTLEGQSISISTVMDKNDLKTSVKPLFSNHFCYLRFVSLKEKP